MMSGFLTNSGQKFEVFAQFLRKISDLADPHQVGTLPAYTWVQKQFAPRGF
jgi:hypothetical protein